MKCFALVAAVFLLVWAQMSVAQQAETLPVRLSWGHKSRQVKPFSIRLRTQNVEVTETISRDFELGDRTFENNWLTKAGDGDVDAIEFKLIFSTRSITTITNLQRIWADLIAQSDPDRARRLRQDPAYRPDDRILTVEMNSAGTQGFSVTVDQLLQTGTFWIPQLDVYLTAGHPFQEFNEHQELLRPFAGQRILDQVQHAPEASYAQFTNLWEDMGNPGYKNPAQTGPGHIVCVTWDSAIPKFGIDRTGGAWNDLGNPDHFHSWMELGRGAPGLSAAWKEQRLAGGLPVVTTVFEDAGVRYTLEQFAYPLDGPPPTRDGEIAMVLLQELWMTNTLERSVAANVQWLQQRPIFDKGQVQLRTNRSGAWIEGGDGTAVFSIQGDPQPVELSLRLPERRAAPSATTELRLVSDLPPHQARRVIAKLPSPGVAPKDRAKFLALEFPAARAQTLAFWSDYLARGAQFRVPEPAVNELFRASLWHALRLPRRHGAGEGKVKLDLPYSNFAYAQSGTPWPVNQAVYVDYMLYGLRGYNQIANEELEAIYANNQEPNGHIGGYASWGVYTPGMIYAVAQNYLLAGDAAAFARVLPQTLRALDWCLEQIAKNGTRDAPPPRGLFSAPLNDLTSDGVWAFNQAYMYAALENLGRALERVGNSRAVECATAAKNFRGWIEEGFSAAMVRAPLVELRDHTWTPYVPCEARTPHRLLQQWYPTDVDTGALHLPRLNALAPQGPLAECLLQDHEDNLYLHGWGMANEPVYNQQATVYLERDQPKAAIRAFYSMMACAFSHSVFEPVEHRWTWGQYFGPPSTDGAWFELFRRMLVRELDNDTLFLLQAAPRAWFEDGKSIEIERAPTYFGSLSLKTSSQAASGLLSATVELPARFPPKTLLIRFRHPHGDTLRSVTVNGEHWTDFNPAKEWVRINNPQPKRYHIQALY